MSSGNSFNIGGNMETGGNFEYVAGNKTTSSTNNTPQKDDSEIKDLILELREQVNNSNLNVLESIENIDNMTKEEITVILKEQLVLTKDDEETHEIIGKLAGKISEFGLGYVRKFLP